MNASLWAAQRNTERELRQELDAVCKQIGEYGKHSSSVVRAGMILAGFHKHHGAWRRRLDRSNNHNSDG